MFSKLEVFYTAFVGFKVTAVLPVILSIMAIFTILVFRPEARYAQLDSVVTSIFYRIAMSFRRFVLVWCQRDLPVFTPRTTREIDYCCHSVCVTC